MGFSEIATLFLVKTWQIVKPHTSSCQKLILSNFPIAYVVIFFVSYLINICTYLNYEFNSKADVGVSPNILDAVTVHTRSKYKHDMIKKKYSFS